jgi:hypothetical protein
VAAAAAFGRLRVADAAPGDRRRKREHIDLECVIARNDAAEPIQTFLWASGLLRFARDDESTKDHALFGGSL